MFGKAKKNGKIKTVSERKEYAMHPKLYGEEAHIVEVLSSRKLDTQLFRKCQELIDAEFWIEISDSDFENSHINE